MIHLLHWPRAKYDFYFELLIDKHFMPHLVNCLSDRRKPSLIARFMGPTGPRCAPCWLHELCYLGCYNKTTGATEINKVDWFLDKSSSVATDKAVQYIPWNVSKDLLRVILLWLCNKFAYILWHIYPYSSGLFHWNGNDDNNKNNNNKNAWNRLSHRRDTW